MLTILLGRTLWSMALNMTTIEGWEIERHETLLRRARVLGGYLVGPEGNKVRIEHQEFPWDVGIWKNLCQAMDSRNPFAWLWPLARSPSVDSALMFEHNCIDGMVAQGLPKRVIQLVLIISRSKEALATARSRSNVPFA